jgi:hypothetical protein
MRYSAAAAAVVVAAAAVLAAVVVVHVCETIAATLDCSDPTLRVVVALHGKSDCS